MNEDQRVDELLNDLDTALSVEPSPAVAAKVRARIANEPTRGWLTWPVVGQAFTSAWFVSTIALLVVAVGTYVAWPRAKRIAPLPQQVAVQPPAAGVPPATTMSKPPSATVASVTDTARSNVKRSTRVSVAAADREPEVLISPSVRLALAQLEAAVQFGQATGTTSAPASIAPDLIEFTPIVIDVIKIDPPATVLGGGTVR